MQASTSEDMKKKRVLTAVLTRSYRRAQKLTLDSGFHTVFLFNMRVQVTGKKKKYQKILFILHKTENIYFDLDLTTFQ